MKNKWIFFGVHICKQGGEGRKKFKRRWFMCVHLFPRHLIPFDVICATLFCSESTIFRCFRYQNTNFLYGLVIAIMSQHYFLHMVHGTHIERDICLFNLSYYYFCDFFLFFSSFFLIPARLSMCLWAQNVLIPLIFCARVHRRTKRKEHHTLFS